MTSPPIGKCLFGDSEATKEVNEAFFTPKSLENGNEVSSVQTEYEFYYNISAGQTRLLEVQCWREGSYAFKTVYPIFQNEYLDRYP